MRTEEQIINNVLDGDFPNLQMQYDAAYQIFFIDLKNTEGIEFNITTAGEYVYPSMTIDFKEKMIKANFGVSDFEYEIPFDKAIEWLYEFGIQSD